jgi:hypothetical protein
MNIFPIHPLASSTIILSPLSGVSSCLPDAFFVSLLLPISPNGIVIQYSFSLNMEFLYGEPYRDNETKKHGLQTTFVKSENISKRRISILPPREWPTPSIAAKGPFMQGDIFSAR